MVYCGEQWRTAGGKTGAAKKWFPLGCMEAFYPVAVTVLGLNPRIKHRKSWPFSGPAESTGKKPRVITFEHVSLSFHLPFFLSRDSFHSMSNFDGHCKPESVPIF